MLERAREYSTGQSSGRMLHLAHLHVALTAKWNTGVVGLTCIGVSRFCTLAVSSAGESSRELPTVLELVWREKRSPGQKHSSDVGKWSSARLW